MYVNVNKKRLPLLVKATKLEKDSTVSKIIDMVQNATESKAKTEKFVS